MYQGVHNGVGLSGHPPPPAARHPRLDRDVVEASQRTRLLEAVGRAVAERGYAAATIDDVVRGAGVSKKTFYEHFADKEDCFLAAYEAASEELFERVREAHATARGLARAHPRGHQAPTCAGSPRSRPWRACS